MKKIFVILFIVFILQISANANITESFLFGKQMYEDKFFDEAIKEFNKVITIAPTSFEAENALLLTGMSFREMSDLKSAEKSFRRLWEGYPNSSFRDKAIYYYALSQYEQGKYLESGKSFAKLIKTFPKSEFTELALELYVESFFLAKEYNEAILTAEDLLRNYSESKLIPDVLLILAKSFFSNNINERGNQTINKIITDFPNSDARWKAVIIKTERIKKNQGTQSAIDVLVNEINTDVPRIHEEMLQEKLIIYYLNLDDFHNAFNHLNILVTRYNNSSKMDFYLSKLFFTAIKLSKYDKIIELQKTYSKLISHSKLKNEINIYVAEANFYLRKFSKSDKIVQEILENSPQDSTLFAANLVKSGILEEKGMLKQAIKNYLYIINSFAKYGKNEELLLKIGNIYYEDFEMFSLAIKYYQQIITNYSDTNFHIKASYKIALCYVKMGKIDEAIEELYQINVNNINDEKLKLKIINKRQYLKKFMQKDYQSAFLKLVSVFNDYLLTKDELVARQNLADILTEDLKEFEKSMELIGKVKTKEEAFQKAKLNLVLAEKSSEEGNFTKETKYLDEASSLMATTPNEKQNPKYEGLRLQIEYSKNKENINLDFIEKLETFIKNNHKIPSANKFRLILSNYYENLSNTEKMLYHLQFLTKDEILLSEYYSAKIKLAELLFQENKYSEALLAYTLSTDLVSINRPTLYYHQAISLIRTGSEKQGINNLLFLLDNTDNFDGYLYAINTVVEYLLKSKNYKLALKYILKIKLQHQDDHYYQSLSDIYFGIGNKEEAKVSLMYIKEKDIPTLHKLALLQTETGDFDIAVYTYKQLLDIDAKNENIYLQQLGKILFDKENFREASENYLKIISKIGDVPDTNRFKELEVELIATETIISLYRIKNRPKAESLLKRFTKIISEKNKNKIQLNRGIYYLDTDIAKAEKVFTKLLKNKNLSKKIRYDVYFWRGVARVKLKKIDSALEDFKLALKSDNESIRNQAHFKIGTIYFTKENFEEAMNQYSFVIENDESGKLALDAAKNFAIVCKTIEEWSNAIDAYEIILERWGDEGLEAETLFNIAFCHFRDKKYKKSIEMFEKVLPLLTEDILKAEAQYWIGESYFGMDDFEQAITAFLKVGYNYSSITRWAATASLKTGESYIMAHKPDKARQIFEKIISKYGKNSQWGKIAVVRLQQF